MTEPRRERGGTASGKPESGGTAPTTRAARRPEMIKQRRAERLQREERDRRQRMLAIAGAVVVVILVVAVFMFLWSRQPAPSIADGGRVPPPAGVETFTDLSRDHVEGTVEYAQVPPVGGPHSPVWQNCGYYPAPIGSENAVHSLEHGAVWITYQPDLPAEQVEALRSLGDDRSFILVSPYPGLQAPVVASAWGVQLELDSTDDPRLGEFVRAFRQGPQSPEPGAVCIGGTSETI